MTCWLNFCKKYKYDKIYKKEQGVISGLIPFSICQKLLPKDIIQRNFTPLETVFKIN